jgi:hypothetical protein
VFYSCANEATKGVKNKGFAALGLFISAMSFIYGNWVFLIHHICGEWLWKPLELIQGARMIADMHEVRVIFNWTGGGLVFAYWVEALALIIGLVCGVNQDGDKPKKECKESNEPASETKKVSSTVVLLEALMGTLFSGCSSEKTKYVLPDSEAVAEWANSQNWEQYEDGKTFLVKNLNGTTYIGIGIAEVPKNEKLIKLNQMRTKALAIKALFNEVEEEIEDPSSVAVVYDEDVDVKGIKKQITIVATSSGRIGGKKYQKKGMDKAEGVIKYISGVDDIAKLGITEGYDCDAKRFVATGRVEVETGDGHSIDVLRVGSVLQFLAEVARFKKAELKHVESEETPRGGKKVNNSSLITSTSSLIVNDLKIINKTFWQTSVKQVSGVSVLESLIEEATELYVSGALLASYSYTESDSDTSSKSKVFSKEPNYDKFMSDLAKSGLNIKVLSERVSCEMPRKMMGNQIDDDLELVKKALNVKGGHIEWESIIMLEDKNGVLRPMK